MGMLSEVSWKTENLPKFGASLWAILVLLQF